MARWRDHISIISRGGGMASIWFCRLLTLVVLTLTICSFSLAKEIPDYSSTPRSEVPDAYKWDRTHVYASSDDFRADLLRIDSLQSHLNERQSQWTGSASAMLAFYEDFSRFEEQFWRAWCYTYITMQEDMSVGESQVLFGEINNRMTAYQSLTAAMEHDILQLGPDRFAKYSLEEAGLEVFAHQVDNQLRIRDHVIPEDGQRIYSLAGRLTSVPSTAADLLRTTNIPNAKVLLSDGTEHELAYGTYLRLMATGTPDDRAAVQRAYNENWGQFDDVMASLLEGEMHGQLFSALARNYGSTLEAHLDKENLDSSIYKNIVDAVHANLPVLHRYHTLKKRALGLSEMRLSDIYVPISGESDITFSLEDTREIICMSLSLLGPKYQQVLNRAFDDRWIDWYSNQYKSTIPYSIPVPGVHPYVSMDFDGSMMRMLTLVHELGHAMHTHFSATTQHSVNSNYSMFLAEMASTFNEHCTIDYMLRDETDDLRTISIIEGYMDGVRLLVYSQMMYAELEFAMHKHVGGGNPLTAEWLNQQCLDLFRRYYGHDQGIVIVDDHLKYGWIKNSELHSNFYAAAYPISKNASLAMYRMVKENGPDDYIDIFLSAGARDYPLSIIEDLGMDLADGSIYTDALAHYDTILDRMEQSIERLEMAGRLPVK